jgi:hypothetical protein
MASAASAHGAGAGASHAPAPAPARVYTISVAGEDPIVVPANELPENSDDLGEVLVQVSAPLGSWVDFLTEYYRQGKLAEYEKLLRKALNLRESHRRAEVTHVRPGRGG